MKSKFVQKQNQVPLMVQRVYSQHCSYTTMHCKSGTSAVSVKTFHWTGWLFTISDWDSGRKKTYISGSNDVSTCISFQLTFPIIEKHTRVKLSYSRWSSTSKLPWNYFTAAAGPRQRVEQQKTSEIIIQGKKTVQGCESQ